MFKSSKASKATTPPAGPVEWPEWSTITAILEVCKVQVHLGNEEYGEGLGFVVACSDLATFEAMQRPMTRANRFLFELRAEREAQKEPFAIIDVMAHAVSFMRKHGFVDAPLSVDVGPSGRVTGHVSVATTHVLMFEKPKPAK